MTLRYVNNDDQTDADAWLRRKLSGSSMASLEKQVDLWKSLVQAVGNGYTFTVYDYTYDVHTRSLLEALMTEVPNIRAGLERELRDADLSFIKATTHSEAFAREWSPSHRFEWETRIPKLLVGE